MALLHIKKYLVEKKSANLQEMALHFQQDPKLLQQMLGHWIRKGRVMLLPQPLGCGSRCVQCKPEYAEVYAWEEKTSIFGPP